MKQNPISPPRIASRLLPAVTAALAAAGLIGSANAQLQVAGDLFVDVDATAQPEGLLNSIANNGTLGGLFEARGGGATVPSVTTINGVKTITFDGTDFLQLAGEIAGPLIPPPAGLVGNESSSIEVWAYNPSIADEETLVSWGKRGGPDGSNVSFNYGSNGTWGAMGHWGAPDMGYADGGGAPSPLLWHHLVYTYDGAMQRVYSDGHLLNEEPIALAIHPDTSIQLAAQLDGDGIIVTGGLRGSLSLAKVRIHDGALTPEQVKQNFDMEKGAFGNSQPPLPLSAAPTHRYSFNEADAADAAGLAINDSVGTAHGTVLGAGASYAGGRLVLAGGGNDTAAYGDLPNGLISANSANNGGSGQLSIEGWARVTGNQGWSRVFDFGRTTAGEVAGPQAGIGPGLDFLFYSAQVGVDEDNHHLEVRNAFPTDSAPVGVNTVGGTIPGEDFHFVITWDEVSRVVRLYENGLLQNTITVTASMSDIDDVNNWLGRSQWDDLNMQGEFDEFRIYDRVLTASEVSGNFEAGPGVVNLSQDPVTFVSQPSSITVYESFNAQFEAQAVGAPPITYQWMRNGSPIIGASASTYSFLPTPADSGAVFRCMVSNTPNGVPTSITSDPATLTVFTQPAPVLKNQYTFNMPAGATSVVDVVGAKDGTLVGNGTYTGTSRLTLDGGSAYVDLPNNLVMDYTSITIETWVQDNGSGGWARIFDFGNSTGGEDFPIGSGTGGLEYMFLSAPSGFGNLRGAYTISGGGAGEQLIQQPVGSLPVGQLKHVVWTSSGPAKAGRLYVDGTLVGENLDVTLTPASLGPTVNNWLGRAQFNDPLFLGEYDEFRIYDGFMLPAQIAASFAAGPETGPVLPRLTIRIEGGNAIISWPDWTAESFFLLESTGSLSAPNWLPEDVAVIQENGFFIATLPLGSTPRFFRLAI